MISGFLLIDKPKGMTSHDVIARIRRILGQKKAGHTGTLDPNATGLLLVALGEATKLIPYLENEDKSYRAEILFGRETDTCDITGTVVRSKQDFTINPQALSQALRSQTGRIEQIPPMYSARKVNGKKLYEYAREGKTVEVKARPVEIMKIDLVEEDLPGRAVIDVDCSKGTYIRSLARDLGAQLDLPSCMGDLRRTRVGSLSLEEALALPDPGQMPEGAARELLLGHLLPADEMLSHLPLAVIPKTMAARLRNGNEIDLAHTGLTEEALPEGPVRIHAEGEDGLLAIGEIRMAGAYPVLKPRRVFSEGI